MSEWNKKIKTDNLPKVVLVGRVNVGKSTLFNRLTETHKALVSTIAGTTRTRNEETVIWRGKNIHLIDTGGLTFTDDVPLEKEIIIQTKKAIAEADLILFVTDAKHGILPQEKELAKLVRGKKTPILLLANKADTAKIEQNIFNGDWQKLGLGEPFSLSAGNGRNVGDLLDLIYKLLNKQKKSPKIEKENEEVINVSIIGKPNVGKSSLFNKLVGEDKVIVSPIAHTTREPFDTLVTYKYLENGKEKNQLINFIDTAGIRRKAKVDGFLEKEGIRRSILSTEDAEVILFVLDGSETISVQDRQLGGLLEKRVKSVIILINKWDLAEERTDYIYNSVKQMIKDYFPHVDFAPILFVSALSGQKIHSIFPEIIHAYQTRKTTVPEDVLHDFMKKLVKEHLPSRDKGVHHPEILGFKQLDINPPVFELYIKPKTSLHRSYINFIERRLREEFDFYGTPIMIRMTKMKR
ncbi:MAG: GTPase Der [Candidatus Magasanikbacteria bacterium GW2011_GWC2_37_14]|uniref:GTPase Der n=1 Tax=Candidatus Magasanikbacteria bacterium GW2011_GWC2_37_14 TaxID=1619046 RepID=A0A0G0JGC2_9BACT|nr:MAG: GTPase Der [Candidatus Magasanikbacteria bacterium GW2011_GWC2_37_14]